MNDWERRRIKEKIIQMIRWQSLYDADRVPGAFIKRWFKGSDEKEVLKTLTSKYFDTCIK